MLTKKKKIMKPCDPNQKVLLKLEAKQCKNAQNSNIQIS